MLKSTTVWVLAGLFFVPLFIVPSRVGSADDSERSRSDDGITTRVKTALIHNDEIKAGQISVETQNGVVQLSGLVDSEHAKSAAGTTALRVAGVAEVRNELRVRDAEASVRDATDDLVIAAQVKGRLAADAGLATASEVNVEVKDGVVQLSGFVPSIRQRQDAERIASQVAGVTDVDNSIAVTPRE
jgi:hyperosmotically inducible protein